MGGGGGVGGGNPKRDLKTLLKNSGLASVNIIGIWISFLKSTSRTDFSKLKSVSGFCV